MKKSTLIAIIAVALLFVSFTATNLKLKQLYNKGEIQSAYVRKSLPAFHFIKEKLDSTGFYAASFKITVEKGKTPGVENYYEEAETFLFTVSNDTLFIQTNPQNKNRYFSMNPVLINTPALNGLEAAKGGYKIQQDNTENMTILADGKSHINLHFTDVKNISIHAKEKAEVILTVDNQVQSADIQLEDKSSLQANDVLFKEKKFRFDKKSQLLLSGRSVESFGITKDTVK